MSGFVLRGALVEYSTDVFGPLPNIVVFQFNPDQISRTLKIPSRATQEQRPPSRTEAGQSGEPPTESFTITAHFSAADDLGAGGPTSAVPRLFGIGPQLAALEKMVYPASGIFSGALGAIVDAVGDALGAGTKPDGRPVAREEVPRLLFIWGGNRVLPVQIESMSITEKQYDAFLNPVLAEVQIGLEVANLVSLKDDKVAEGALKYTQTVKDAQAVLNLAKAAELALDIVPF